MSAISLAALAASTSQGVRAFHYDIHFYSTAALAVASGWPADDALWIAATDEAVDRNHATVAGLEANTLLRGQSEKNYAFHCFSRVDDTHAERVNGRNHDVTEQLSDLRQRATDALRTAQRTHNSDADRRRIEALVAVGLFFHCQQDSWSHSGYGGRRLGHFWSDAFGNSPDLPGRRPAKTELALREGLAELNAFAKDWQGSRTPQDATLSQLLRGLTEKSLLSAPDEYGRQLFNNVLCTADLPRYWLYRELAATGRLAQWRHRSVTPAGTCGSAYELAFNDARAQAQMIVFDPPQFPRLDTGGRPRFATDGTPQFIGTDGFDYEVRQASAATRQQVRPRANTARACSS